MTIYTDGSSRGNPGPGGYGVVVVEQEKVIAAYSQQEECLTNNQAEIKAILYALKHYGAKDGDFLVPIVYSDSSYCVNSFTNWIKNWKMNGWTRSGGKKLENLDLIQAYDALSQIYKIDLRKIKGHSGKLYNELADALATGKMTAKEVLMQYGKTRPKEERPSE